MYRFYEFCSVQPEHIFTLATVKGRADLLAQLVSSVLALFTTAVGEFVNK